MAATRNDSKIQEFYHDTSVFITGGTGFLGKLIIEKLLRSCTGIKKIYILCRARKGKDLKNRLDEQFDSVLYDLVRKADPEFKSKIVPISGECADTGLGINEDDRDVLSNEINIILHCAATVRFDEHLRKAVRINIRATRDLLLLARGMKQLKAFVHVSTAYSNCVRYHIEEKLHEPPFDGNQLITLVETADEDTLSRITPGLLGEYPNTYTYSKAIAESVVKQNSEGLPVCIVRPGIIVSTFQEPYRGWCDNMNGPMGGSAAMLQGVLHSMHCDPNKIAALVPVDYVANATIVAAWDVAQTWNEHQQNKHSNGSKLERVDKIPVYNYAGCAECPITWGVFLSDGFKFYESIPTINCYWVNFMIMNKYQYANQVCQCVLHLLPAYIVDGLLFCFGKKISFVRIYKFIHKMMDTIAYFTTHEWKFENENTKKLYAKLNDADKALFNFDMSVMSWSEWLKNYVTGLRVYILKDPLTTLPQAKRKHMMLKIASKTLLIGLIFSFYYIWVLLKYIF